MKELPTNVLGQILQSWGMPEARRNELMTPTTKTTTEGATRPDQGKTVPPGGAWGIGPKALED